MTAMPQYAFDTLKYVKRLEKAGLKPEVAEAQAEVQLEALSNFLDRHVASKDDIKSLEIKIKESEIRILGRIDKQDARIDKQYSRMDKLDSKIDKLDSRMDKQDSRMDRLELKIDSLEHKITVKLGRWIIASVGFLSALMTLFHFL